ncbi:MAG: aldo/keto reductase [Leptolyngbyaceae cyanobacterium RM1_1_2]|nr:aldo/keto reductase [Leptolyngbyaceae cyanobacterium RM1_1_2]
MQQRTLGTSDVQITPVIMGTWQAGKKGWVGVEDNAVVDAMQAALEAGITTFDTAEVYGDGYSEQLVGKALSNKRDRVVIATKVFASHLKFDQVVEACERSLKNLQTDYIDLYQIHWPAGAFNSEVVPVSETLQAMNQLKEQGKIRAIGVSNFSGPQLAEALEYAQIDSLQPPYSLFWRQLEQDAMPLCVEKNVAIIAYSALAQGLLTGKFGLDHRFEEGDIRAKNKLFQGDLYQKAQSALDQLRPIAQQYQTSLGNLAIAWLIAQPQANAIVGARNVEQAVENAKAGSLEISAADLKKIDQIGRTVTDYVDSDPVMWKFSA